MTVQLLASPTYELNSLRHTRTESGITALAALSSANENEEEQHETQVHDTIITVNLSL